MIRTRVTAVVAAVGVTVLPASCGSTDKAGSGSETTTSRNVASTTTTASVPDTLPPLAPGKVASNRKATAALFAGIKPDGPGCTVAVARDGKVLFAEAYGLADIDARTANTTATVMDIASVSKQFTAFAILLLADEGKLSLDDDIHKYVPTLPDYGAKVTLRQMMHHRSGIADYADLLISKNFERTTIADALDAIRQVPKLDFPPGSKFDYSNSNYFLFSFVVERASGTPLPQYLQTRVFRPAGIAAIMDPVGAVPRKARSYLQDNARWVNGDSKWEQIGDGAIQTTPTELVKWATQYWAPTVGSAAVHRARFEGAVPATPDYGVYGAGIGRKTLPDGAVVLSHEGGWAGFSTMFALIPKERLAVASICNGYPLPDVKAEQFFKIWRG